MRQSVPRPRTGTAVALVATTLVLGSCEEPSRPSLSFELNENIVANEDSKLFNPDLAGDPVAQAQLQGALEMLFGTPDSPGYLRPEEWVDDGYDPNVGDLLLSEERYEEILADNLNRFAPQLAKLEAGRYDDISVPSHMLGLKESWESFIDDREALQAEIAESKEAGEDPGELEAELAELDAEIAEFGPEMFEFWYPSLRESAELYRQQCNHCHGTSGGADGSTAPFLNPRPRDYRAGVFKFTAVGNKARPRHEDLVRILDEGVYGTAMPSFRRFSEAELSGLADYVRLLSIRGETELLVGLEYDSSEYGFPLETVQETYLDVWEKWGDAYDEVIAYEGEVPEATPERIAHGRELYMDGGSANCVSCHGPDGRGNGPSAYEARVLTEDEQAEVSRLVTQRDEILGELERALDVTPAESATYDERKDAIAAALAEHEDADEAHHLDYRLGAMKRLGQRVFDTMNKRVSDDWGNEIVPRDLTRGLYRFGRRPIDLYRRIHAGINGTPMPSHAEMKTPEGERMLSDDDLWDIVHYVRSISVEEMHASDTTTEEESGHDSHGL